MGLDSEIYKSLLYAFYERQEPVSLSEIADVASRYRTTSIFPIATTGWTSHARTVLKELGRKGLVSIDHSSSGGPLKYTPRIVGSRSSLVESLLDLEEEVDISSPLQDSRYPIKGYEGISTTSPEYLERSVKTRPLKDTEPPTFTRN